VMRERYPAKQIGHFGINASVVPGSNQESISKGRRTNSLSTKRRRVLHEPLQTNGVKRKKAIDFRDCTIWYNQMQLARSHLFQYNKSIEHHLPDKCTKHNKY
jgi:hypothetical protein